MWYSCIGKRLGKQWRAYYIEIMAIKLELYILSICSGIWPLLSYVLVENIFASFSYYMNYIQWMSMYRKYRSKKAGSYNKTQLSNLMIAIVYIRNSSWNSLRSKRYGLICQALEYIFVTYFIQLLRPDTTCR